MRWGRKHASSCGSLGRYALRGGWGRLWFGERLSLCLDNRWFVEQETWRLLLAKQIRFYFIPFLDCVNNRKTLGAARFRRQFNAFQEVVLVSQRIARLAGRVATIGRTRRRLVGWLNLLYWLSCHSASKVNLLMCEGTLNRGMGTAQYCTAQKNFGQEALRRAVRYYVN